MIADRIRKVLEDEYVPVYGIAPASAMGNEKPGHRPEDLLPGAQSLICFGIPVSHGIYHMPSYGLETAWRSQNLNYRRLDTISMRIAALVEENGEQAVPTYGCMPLGLNEQGNVVGYMNQIRMGEVTGIGVVGKSGLLINSRFGARLMLGGLLTTSILPAMCYSGTDEPGCPSDCFICAKACPVNAIMPDKKQVKVMRCLNYTARTPAMSRLKFVFLRSINPQKAARYMSLTSFDEHTFHICSKCISLCPYGNQN